MCVLVLLLLSPFWLKTQSKAPGKKVHSMPDSCQALVVHAGALVPRSEDESRCCWWLLCVAAVLGVLTLLSSRRSPSRPASQEVILPSGAVVSLPAYGAYRSRGAGIRHRA